MSAWHIQDIATITTTDIGVRIQNIGYDLTITDQEARKLADALNEATGKNT